MVYDERDCENKEVAAEFIAFVTEYMAKESFLQGSGIPVWDFDTSEEEIDPSLNRSWNWQQKLMDL